MYLKNKPANAGLLWGRLGLGNFGAKFGHIVMFKP